MSDLLSLQMLLFAAEACAASSLVMALAWLAAARGTASRRHLVWAGAFGALIALPTFVAIVPAQIRLSLAAPVIPVTQGFDTASVASLPEPSGFSIGASTIALALIALWLLGIAFIAARGAIAAFALHRLRRQSVPHRFGHLPITGPRCALRLAPRDCGPMTWGIFRPVILLPSEAETWPRARLEAVLLHELAHIRRCDTLAQLLALVVCALYWPNPLVWLGARRLRREAETAADDAVLEAGVKPSAYAGELLRIASEFRVQRLSLPLAMAAPSALEARVKSVLEPNQSRSGVTAMDVLKIACLGVMATTAIAFARPSLAQDAPQVQSTPLPPPQADTRVVHETDSPGQKVVRESDTGGGPAPHTLIVDGNAIDPAPGTITIVRQSGTKGHVHTYRYTHVLNDDKAVVIGDEVTLKPDIERAMRATRAAEAAMRAVEAERPQIEAAMAKALRETKQMNEAQIQAAIAAAHKALANVPNEAQIDAQVARAMAHARMQVETVRLRMRDGDTIETPEPPDDADAHVAPPALAPLPSVPPAPLPAPPPASPAPPQN